MAVACGVAHTKPAINNKGEEMERKDVMAPLALRWIYIHCHLPLNFFIGEMLYVAVSLQSISKL